MSKKIIIEDAAELKDPPKTGEQDPEFPFFSVDIKQFSSVLRNLHFDVYLKISEEKMTRVFSQDTGVDFKRLAQYISKGVKDLYVAKKDAAAFANFIVQSPKQILDSDATTRAEKITALLDMSDQNVSQLFEIVNVPEDVAEKTKVIVKNFIKFLDQEPSIITNLLKSINHNDAFFYHSVAVSVISMMITNKANNDSDQMQETCGLAGLLHDIGKSQIPKDSLDKQTEYRQHSKLSYRMLEGCACIRDEVRMAVFQHHEEPGGGGFPTGIRGPKIIYPSKVVALANAFINYISPQQSRKPFTPEQAINTMLLETGRFDRALLNTAASLFAAKKQ